MNFSFSDEQIAFRDAVRDLLEQHCTPAHVRNAWTNATGRVPGLWKQLVDMGVVDVLAHGGTMADLVLVLEETGRYAVPEPIVESATRAPSLLTRPNLCVAAGGDLIAWADTADVIVAPGGHFDPGTAQLIAHPSVDGARRLFEVRGEPFEARDQTHIAFIRGACGTAAQLCGLTDRMLELTSAYVKERRQFGVPVGSFQAVKHHLANARIALEFTRPLVYRAAVTVDHVHTSMALAKAADTALSTARAALQCHGAIGYTTEYDLHLYMKRAWALARAYGDARFHRARVAEAIL